MYILFFRKITNSLISLSSQLPICQQGVEWCIILSTNSESQRVLSAIE